MMNVIDQSVRKSLVSNTPVVSPLSLYEQYGAVAYGVILQIVPQPHQAQEVLLDLFTSSVWQKNLLPSSNSTCAVVHMARSKALEYRQKQQLPALDMPKSTTQSELIFSLLFYQNQSPDSIADRLQIKRSAVFGAVREFFASVLPS
ncbi:hypothetical protein [Fibrella aquatica]|uniref:hypothetical protein n=1 Tax=Fibrella aquatica TaxID=3242487 RepID=UPI003520869D